MYLYTGIFKCAGSPARYSKGEYAAGQGYRLWGKRLPGDTLRKET